MQRVLLRLQSQNVGEGGWIAFLLNELCGSPSVSSELTGTPKGKRGGGEDG